MLQFVAFHMGLHCLPKFPFSTHLKVNSIFKIVLFFYSCIRVDCSIRWERQSCNGSFII